MDNIETNKLFEKLLNGPVVLIDDEIGFNSSIDTIKNNLLEENLPILEYRSIPDKRLVERLYCVSFIIADWNFQKRITELFDFGDEDEEIEYTSSMRETDHRDITEFLIEVQNQFTVPIFVFTAENIDEIKNDMLKYGMTNSSMEDMLFCDKEEIKDAKNMKKILVDWMKSKPSMYVMKEWEYSANRVKDQMFKDLTKGGSRWVSILYEHLKEDGDQDSEFTDFLNRQFVNRFETIRFEKDYIGKEGGDSYDELRRVLQVARYITYDNSQPPILHTGDLIKDNNNNYWINISAACDMARKGKDGFTLLVVKGEAIGIDILAEDSKKSSTKRKYQCNRSEYHEKKDEVYELCIADEALIRFDLKCSEYKEYPDDTLMVLGRLLPPDITRIQQKFASYIVREGVMSIPRKQLMDAYIKEKELDK